MKQFKLLVGTMAVCSLILSVPTMAKAEDVEGDTSNRTSPAELTVTSGGLTFREPVATSAKINFAVTLNGEKQEGVAENGNAYVTLDDNRGKSEDKKWTLTVKQPISETNSFNGNGLVLNFAPEVIDGNSICESEKYPVNKDAVIVATGNRFAHEIKLNPTLDVPKDVLAQSYQTELEWTLSPLTSL